MTLAERIYQVLCKCPETPCPLHETPMRPFEEEPKERGILGDGTYENRNQRFVMDAEMFAILEEAGMESPAKLIDAFNHGRACGRIVKEENY